MSLYAARRAAIGLLTLLAIVAVVPGAQGATDWAPTIARLESPAAQATAQPQLSVSSRGVLLSWIEHGDKDVLKFSERTATGWSTPRTVASGDDWFVNWADVPSVMRLADGTLVAHWLQMSGADTYAYDVRLSYSNDDGRTWSASFTPHHDGTKTEHGFASLFQMPGAGLGLVWLDGRAMKPESEHGAEGHDGHGASKGAMSVRFATFDKVWKQTAEMPVDVRVCECCPTTAAVTSEGPIVAFRNRTDDEVRDIHVSRLENGTWTSSKAVYEDGWKIPACPVNGPMLSARGRNVAIAWFTVKNDVGQSYVAFSTDAGRTFGAPARIDQGGSLGRVDIDLAADGSAVATWIEFADQRAQVRTRRIQPSGVKSAPVTVTAIEGARASGYPRLARSGNELVFAWTESRNGDTRVQTAVARLPAERQSR